MSLVSTTYLMCTKGQQLQYGSRVTNFCLAKRKVVLFIMLQRNAPLTRAPVESQNEQGERVMIRILRSSEWTERVVEWAGW